jgi:hypothetical protein
MGCTDVVREVRESRLKRLLDLLMQGLQRIEDHRCEVSAALRHYLNLNIMTNL